MSERTYTESELAVERAALQREAAAECDKRDNLPSEIQRRILAIPTDQSALARHDEELKAQLAKVLAQRDASLAEPPNSTQWVSRVESQMVEAAAYERGKLRDTAWLVERRDRGAIEYLNADGLGGDWDWTTDSIKAIHFCRRVDADKVGAIFDDLDIHICEHEWAGLQDRGREADNEQ